MPTLSKTLLWKYFQSCMCSFREKWEINFTIWHTVPHFKQHGCLRFQWNRKNLPGAILRLHDRLLMALCHGFCLLNKEKWSVSFKTNTKIPCQGIFMGYSRKVFSTNTSLVFRVETTRKWSLPCCFNVEYTRCVCRVGDWAKVNYFIRSHNDSPIIFFYFSNNVTKTYWYRLIVWRKIEIKHLFHFKAYFHVLVTLKCIWNASPKKFSTLELQ